MKSINWRLQRHHISLPTPNPVSWNDIGIHMREYGANYRGVDFSVNDITAAVRSKDVCLSPGPLWRRRDILAVLAEAMRRRVRGD